MKHQPMLVGQNYYRLTKSFIFFIELTSKDNSKKIIFRSPAALFADKELMAGLPASQRERIAYMAGMQDSNAKFEQFKELKHKTSR